MADSVLKQVYADTKVKIEALIPRSYWNDAERFIVVGEDKSANTVATDVTHRSVYMGYTAGTVDMSTLSMAVSPFKSKALTIQVFYQALTPGKEFLEQATTMAAEDEDDIIDTLQRLSTFPAITGGYMYHRRYVADSIIPDPDMGRLTLVLVFEIIYGA